jgi:16S rRNA (uracil1498-N3)-methyltransferase
MNDFRIPSESLTERRIGAILTARDEVGDEYRARVVAIEADMAVVHPFEKLSLPSESALSVTLVQALPKKEKMEWIIQKATELGVSAIVPCVSEKSVTLEERDRLQAKSLRWQEIARKAKEQSRRRKVPFIERCTTLQEALKIHAANAGLNLILYEKESNNRLKDVSWVGVEHLTIVCGPDGGFSEVEVSTACAFNYIPVSLGSRILRCETAAVAALSIVQFVSGNL